MAAVLVLATLVGCGSSGEDTTKKQERIYPNVKGPTRQFLVANGDNVVQFYGREASQAEREEASRTIHAWLRARAKQDWPKDCSYFHHRYRERLVDDARSVSGGKADNCPQALAYFGHKVSGSLVDNLRGPIISFRVRAGKGYAQYHGTDGSDWILPMNKESGKWKVSNARPLNRLE